MRRERMLAVGLVAIVALSAIGVWRARPALQSLSSPGVIDVSTPADSSRGSRHRGDVSIAGDSARGLALMNAFRDSLPAFSGNALRCTSCHLENGTRPTSMSWVGVAPTYPRFRSRSATQETLIKRVNDCIIRSLAGHVIADDSRDMRDMVAYLESLGKRSKPGAVDTVKLVGNAAAGGRAFTAQCARCHGATGNGTALAPAVFGTHSFSIGAGLARQNMMATFIRHNMPYDRAGTLTDQEAADIASFVLMQPRQDFPGKENDWPRGDPPADVAYATNAARAAGKPLPPRRPVLPRRVMPYTTPARSQ